MKKAFFTFLFISVLAIQAFGGITKTVQVLVPMGLPELNKNDVTVKHIKLGGAADKAGLQVGDKIYKINKVRVNNHKKWRKETKKIAPIKGQNVTIEVKRQGKTKKFELLTEKKGKIGVSIVPEKFWVTRKTDDKKNTLYGAFQATTDNPSGENSAKALLERIKKERGALKNTKKRKK